MALAGVKSMKINRLEIALVACCIALVLLLVAVGIDIVSGKLSWIHLVLLFLTIGFFLSTVTRYASR